MTSAQPSKPAGWFTGRTRLITIVSIVAVGLAGATAVSANIGILDSASDSPVGNASVTGGLTTAPPQVVDVYLPSTNAVEQTSVPATGAAVQQFAVDVAGTVSVETTDAGLRLDRVTPAAGWSWSLAQSDPAALMVTMTDGSRTFEFTATTTADGNIAASVNEPIVTSVPAVNSGGDDEHEDDHEGDHDEYEGGEDDD